MEIVSALIAEKSRERGSDDRAHRIEGARTRGAQNSFEFGETQLDGIEVGTVGGQEAERRADRFD